MDFPLKTGNVMDEDIESMHVESTPDKHSGATRLFPPSQSSVPVLAITTLDYIVGLSFFIIILWLLANWD